ncbi:MAG: carboxylating nicotinate-nucleotide diphosphorylase [Synechococcaceae cyanobacterium RL_1_2]|nr:carboxylating nicotinate-nucleotide diphosphorylase [Synechococcaceae cyanobacterium RL_1_2]
MNKSPLPPWLVIDPLLKQWLREDIGRGDRTTNGLESNKVLTGYWLCKEQGMIAGLTIAARVFHLLDGQTKFKLLGSEGQWCDVGQKIVDLQGNLDTLMMGERVALNLAMHLSGIATMTRRYTEVIKDLPAQLVDTRKTTPGLRLLEKYATQLGGAANHRVGLDDAVLIKDNHIAAAGGIGIAIEQIRATMPYPLSIEVETETLEQVKTAIDHQADIIMLDNMTTQMMQQAVKIIRQSSDRIKIEASGNVTLDNLRAIAETGVDYISSSAPITRSPWLDLSMKID